MLKQDGSAVGPLEERLDAMRLQAKEVMPAETLKELRTWIDEMRSREKCPRGLVLGSPVPDFVLSEAWGAQFWLKEALEKGPVIVVFYRGTWCPFCQVTMAYWQEQLPKLQTRGVQLVAISPQYPEATGEIVKKLGLEFPVLCDPGNRVAHKYAVVCKQEETLKRINEAAHTDLEAANKDCSQELPLPGTFLIGQDNTLLYSHVDVDFTRRAEPADVLAKLVGDGA